MVNFLRYYNTVAAASRSQFEMWLWDVGEDDSNLLLDDSVIIIILCFHCCRFTGLILCASICATNLFTGNFVNLTYWYSKIVHSAIYIFCTKVIKFHERTILLSQYLFNCINHYILYFILFINICIDLPDIKSNPNCQNPIIMPVTCRGSTWISEVQ